MLYWDNLKDIKAVLDALSSGRVVAGTSDTVLGLLAPCMQNGLNQINAIKGRSNKPCLTLIADSSKMAQFVGTGDMARLKPLIDYAWPGPLTLVCRAKDTVPAYLCGADGTVALRVPDHAGLLGLLHMYTCMGLFSTSANKAGEPVPADIKDLHRDILDMAAHLIIDKTPPKHLVPSTILDCSGETIRVIREGAFSIEELETVMGESFIRPTS